MPMNRPLSRRAFVASAACAVALPALGVVARGAPRGTAGPRLTARPRQPSAALEPGVHALGLASGRDALVYLPRSLDRAKPAALILALHGATQAGELMATRLAGLADATGAVLLAPDSRGGTWDAIRGEFGADPAFLDRALGWTFDRVAVDPKRVWLAGFSDGASYGLSLGIANGDFFTRVLAFSPGFVIPVDERGKPRFFVSHGRQDPILPIDQCSRRIVPELRRAGYDVRFDEFDGGHRMPPEILDAAAQWLRA